MRTPGKITLLALGALLSGLATPAVARDSTGGAVPFSSAPATGADLQDKGVTTAEEPGVPCVLEATAQDHERARLAGVKIGEQCLPQQDAFKRAAEAASYLAYYQQTFSDFGQMWGDDKTRTRIQKSVQACLTGGPDCNQNDLLRALVQYNFGKELKAQMVENQSRAERMKSLDLGKGWREINAKPTRNLSSRVRSSSLRKNTFRLDPKKVEVLIPEKLTAEERARLGTEFNAGFNQFVNEYTSSTGQIGLKSRWHYVVSKTAAVAGGNVFVAAFDPRNEDRRQGLAAIDKSRLERDARSQSSAAVEEIVGSFREKYKDVLANKTVTQQIRDPSNPRKAKSKDIDSMSAAYQDMGFGLPRGELARIGMGGPDDPRDEKDVAAAQVIKVNKAINDKEKEMLKGSADDRFPSSEAKAPRITPSVTVDVQAFDKFLDQIWPGGAKP